MQAAVCSACGKVESNGVEVGVVDLGEVPPPFMRKTEVCVRSQAGN